MSDVINGSDLYLFRDGTTPLAHATSHELSIKVGTRNISDKEIGDYEQVRPTRLVVTGSAEGLVAYGSFETLLNAIIARAPIKMYFGRAIGDVPSGGFNSSASYASGYFYLTDYKLTAPDGNNSTYSISFEHCSGFGFIAK